MLQVRITSPFSLVENGNMLETLEVSELHRQRLLNVSDIYYLLLYGVSMNVRDRKSLHGH